MVENSINNTEPFFMVGDIAFFMIPVSEEQMTEMRKDPETGSERHIQGYPYYYTQSKRLWPLPFDGIEVIYG